jgi:hypothetical protein
MNPVELPPPLPARAPVPTARRALRSLAWLAGLLALAWLAMRLSLPLPPCPLRAATEVPCPFCGSTRAFAAMAQLDFSTALRLNPFVCLAALGAGFVWLLALRRGDEWLKQIAAGFNARAGWKWLLALALAANWLYLWHHLPR